jgi:hypothetical protein
MLRIWLDPKETKQRKDQENNYTSPQQAHAWPVLFSAHRAITALNLQITSY